MELNSYNTLMSAGWLEIRLFYVRITPCVVEAVPDSLTLRHLRREETAFTPLEINGSRVPAAAGSASVSLRRDRLDRESSEVTYVSTDSVRVTGAVEFEVMEGGDLVLCGSLEKVESLGHNAVGPESDARTGWSLECYMAASVGDGGSAFFQPKLGISAPTIEVYIAGCCGGVPIILTKTILVSPRRKVPRHGALDAIPEDEELGKEEGGGGNEEHDPDVAVGVPIIRHHRKVKITETDGDENELDLKYGNRYYSDELYYGEDGQLSWFNAGVRVGVGIGLGMCLGAGIGVGLLMRSYQATTRNFRRRFF